MRRFAFQLESVLKFKQRRELLAEMQQKQAAAVVRTAEAEAAAVESELVKTCSYLQQKMGKAQDSATWVAIYSQASRLQEALQAATKRVVQANQALAKANAVRKQAAIEAEALVTLRRRAWEEHREKREKETQESLDELGMRRWTAQRPATIGDGESEVAGR